MVRRINVVSNKPPNPRRPERIEQEPVVLQAETLPQPVRCPNEQRIAALEARVAELEARPIGREVVKVESTAVERLPQTMINEWEAFKRDLAKFKDSQEFVLPQAFAEMVERVQRLESSPRDITPGSTDTTVIERLTAVEGSVNDLQDNNDAHRKMIETAAGFADIARQIMRQVDENRARADTQYGVAMDHVKDLSATIRRAIG